MRMSLLSPIMSSDEMNFALCARVSAPTAPGGGGRSSFYGKGIWPPHYPLAPSTRIIDVMLMASRRVRGGSGVVYSLAVLAGCALLAVFVASGVVLVWVTNRIWSKKAVMEAVAV